MFHIIMRGKNIFLRSYESSRPFNSKSIDYGHLMRSATSPLWQVPYKMQLELKYLRMKSLLQKLTNDLVLFEASTGSVATLARSSGHDGLCCPLSKVIASPQVEGYRNKSDFCVGVGEDGNKKTVGMLVGNWKKKNVVCVPADKCLNISSEHNHIGKILLSDLNLPTQVKEPASKKADGGPSKHAQLYQQFLRQSSLDVMTSFHGDGHWRECTVRSNMAGESMAIVQINPRDLDRFQLDEHKEHLKEFFLKDNSVASLFLQSSSKTRTYDNDSIELLFGERHLHEKLHDLTFRISPLAFFQPNTKCAELLYSTIRDFAVADSSRDIVLLDLYCGTGTIGLYLSASVHRVIGIEIVDQAVQDATINAKINGITNAEFVCGSVESVLPRVLSSLEPNQEVVAVVDPSRNGIHPNVVKLLRNCESVSKLIYVSCKPDGNSFNDFIKLCQPVGGGVASGRAWQPVQAVPVDMFPQTIHCELVIQFERQ